MTSLETNFPGKNLHKYFTYKSTDIQLTTHQWIQFTPYTCNKPIFLGLLFTSNEIFLKSTIKIFVSITLTLLLVPFESKLVNS